VHLWQLDAPATEHWTRGDRRWATLRVGTSGKVVEGLPEGLYRVECEAQLRGVVAPPPFAVRGDRTEVELPVRLPREFEVRLRVVDERGRAVTRDCLADYTAAAIGDEAAPTWVVPRRRGDTGALELPEQETVYETEERPVSAENGLYRLGTMRQDHGSFRRTRQWVLGHRHATCVLVSVDGTIDADRTYVGATVPLARIREVIRLPGGGDPDEIDIYATCTAVPEGLVAWDWLAVDVSAHFDGYETLVFQYRVGGPNEVHLMRPK
jgi:hypothetical protein